ncbi:MAG: cell envelope integrity protein CreD [Ignavibacteriaceae bacterium]
MKKDSIIIRIVISTFIILLLIVPLTMIQSLITERQKNRQTVIKEISQSWADSQIVAGPILCLVKDQLKENREGKKVLQKNKYYLLPESLNIKSEVYPEKRHRGIYEVILYKTAIKVTGSFDLNNLQKIKYDDIINNSGEEYISFNITDLKGVEDSIFLNWNGQTIEVNPGLRNRDIFKNGFYSDIKIENGIKKYNFELTLHLKGSENLQFIPMGKITEVHMNSGWNNPSFTGEFLPSSRNLSSKGFNAEWKINQFNRNYPQEWYNETYNLYPSSFGVKLLIPVDEYQKTMRTSKYGILIILLTFVSFFMIEIFNKKPLHPVQYLLIGLSLVIFYSLLLALSEYMLFEYSYLISSVLVIGLISFYTKNIYSKTGLGISIGGMLILFYGFMYTILQLQDYSLLLGTLALFIILAGIMFLTRKINWYEVLSSKNTA